MKDKKRVACFFTGGYTELNAMKLFVKRINDSVEYRQLCPIAPRKSRDVIRNRTKIAGDQGGLTGDSLVRFVLNAVDKPYFTRESYDAILIEDDKDARFLNISSSTIDMEKWNVFKNDVRRQLAEKGVTVPVIILFAAPEVEAWFISDWENSFGRIYKDDNVLNSAQNSYFSIVFHRYVKDVVLTEKYSKNIEAYGFFDGEYKKLSEEIQSVLNCNDFMKDYTLQFEHSPIYYSKREHGAAMLENIDPIHVLRDCTLFFKEAFHELQNI